MMPHRRQLKSTRSNKEGGVWESVPKSPEIAFWAGTKFQWFVGIVELSGPPLWSALLPSMHRNMTLYCGCGGVGGWCHGNVRCDVARVLRVWCGMGAQGGNSSASP